MMLLTEGIEKAHELESKALDETANDRPLTGIMYSHQANLLRIQQLEKAYIALAADFERLKTKVNKLELEKS